MSNGRKLRFGVIGAGAFAEACHVPGLLSHPQAAVVAICGRRRERAQALADRFSIPFVTTEPAELCARDDLDGVSICTPNVAHREQAVLAFGHGKHVFCEKPLGISVAEAAEMTRAAEASGLIHQIAFTYRHLHGVTELRRLVQERSVSRTSFVLIMNTGRGFSRPRRSVGGGCEALLVAACSTIRARIFLISRALSSDRSRQSARTCSFFPGGASRLTTLRQYVSASPRVSAGSGTPVGSRHRGPITTCR
jgi:predicted dehydrogenase